MIRAFASYGSLLEANLCFCKVLSPSQHTWHAIILAHINQGEHNWALRLYYEGYCRRSPKVNHLMYPCILKSCARVEDLRQGKFIHDEVIINEFESDVIIGSTLIDMYAKCGRIEDAQKVFDDLPHRNVVSWNAMLTGYVQHNNALEALGILGKMYVEGIKPDKVMYLCILKACSSLSLLEQGRLAHDQIVRSKINVDLILGSTLIDMYAKCGNIEDAVRVFDELPQENIVSMGAMISAHAQHGDLISALSLFGKLQELNINSDKVTFLSILKMCGDVQFSQYGWKLHDLLMRNGLGSDLMVANTLISMYCKQENLREAQNVFRMLQNRDVVSYGVLMSGYLQQGLFYSVIELFWQMQISGIKPDETTFVCSLKSSGIICALNEGISIHCQVIENAMEMNPVICGALIEMYAKNRYLREACNVFQHSSDRNMVPWTAMISNYIEQGLSSEALQLFDEMHNKGIAPDKVTFLIALKACIDTTKLEKGEKVNCEIVTYGLETDVAIGSTLVDMYAKCGQLEAAEMIFNSLPHQNVVTWGVLVSGYVQYGQNSVAFDLFERMQSKGVYPDRAIFLSLLGACLTSETLMQIKLIHDKIIKHGIHSDTIIGNALIDSYGKSGSPVEAQNVFDRLSCPDLISWCSVITSYAENGHSDTAFHCFYSMQEEGLEPNTVILLCILKACYNEGAYEEGKLVHHMIIYSGVELDAVMCSALIDMYSKCGNVDDAYGVFGSFKNHDVVSWSTMLTAFGLHEEDFSVLELFEQMQSTGIRPNDATFLSILKACGNLGAIVQGQILHDQIIRSSLHLNSYLGNAMIDMYGTFGMLKESMNVFTRLSKQDRVSWEAMISGFSLIGDSVLANKCFELMQREGLLPEETTYSTILSALSHSGRVDEGHSCFNHIIKDDEISTKTEHFNCIIDLLGRTGSLQEAEKVLLSMPGAPDIIGWMTLLSACKKHGNIHIGKRCFENVSNQDYNFTPGYMIMSNIYGDNNIWEGEYE